MGFHTGTIPWATGWQLHMISIIKSRSWHIRMKQLQHCHGTVRLSRQSGKGSLRIAKWCHRSYLSLLPMFMTLLVTSSDHPHRISPKLALERPQWKGREIQWANTRLQPALYFMMIVLTLPTPCRKSRPTSTGLQLSVDCRGTPQSEIGRLV